MANEEEKEGKIVSWIRKNQFTMLIMFTVVFILMIILTIMSLFS